MLHPRIQGADACGEPNAKRLGEWLRAALAVVRLWRRRIQERRELATMSERDWRDIGITNADATQEVDKPFWR